MWQPIETAPKDQTFLAVLNCAGEQTICTMRWPVAEAKNSRPDHHAFHVERVTHWMPLPALPGAHPAPIEDSITAGILSGMFLSLDGHDKAQPGYEWRKGWNDAIRQAMDYAQPAPSIPEGIQRVARDFYWDSAALHHVPFVRVEFQPVVANAPNDAKGWQDRDRFFAAMLAAAPETKP